MTFSVGRGFEEDFEEAMAETIGDPLGEGLLGLDRDEARLDVTEEDVEGFVEAEIEEGVHRFQGIIEVAALVINPGEARAIDEIVGHDLPPDFVDFLGFAEEAVAADVEAEAFGLDGPGNAADVSGVGFPYDDLLAGAGKFPRGGEAGGTSTHNNDWLFNRHKEGM